MMKSTKRRLTGVIGEPAEAAYLGRCEDDTLMSLPAGQRARLHELFALIEKEFDILYTENLNLQEKVEILSEKLGRENFVGDRPSSELIEYELIGKATKPKLSQSSSSKVKTSHKLRAQTSRIVSSFKAPSFSCQLVRELSGHKDGIWEVSPARPGEALIGTASADHTASVWSVEWGKCLLQYLGHTGSVNSVRFHPSRDLALTASGDTTAHIWQAAVNWELQRAQSSEEELDGAEEGGEAPDRPEVLRTPLTELTGHSGVVVACDWLPGGEHAVTASWDRTAALYHVESGDCLQTLTGHEHELTYVCAHATSRLIVTASRDSTFRLWDCREWKGHPVSVFQGHTESVTSAVFHGEDKVVSGSDDRTVKVWDVRNMRSALVTIRSDSAVNRIAVSSAGLIAIPHDNRQVRLFDLQGQRLARLSRSTRQGHRRMVTSVAWCDTSCGVNLLSCGFDRRVLGWLVQPNKD